MPKSLALIRKLRAAGVAATVSGAGPAVLVLHIGSELEAAEIMKSAPDSFAALTVNISPTGVQ
jgi:homoserine kinase